MEHNELAQEFSNFKVNKSPPSTHFLIRLSGVGKHNFGNSRIQSTKITLNN
jgi:hypothetical protein